MPDFIRPNYHVILIHYPLALLGLGILIELFSFLWPRGTFRVAGRWMILLGALLSIPASTSGLYALWDAASHRTPTGSGWRDTLSMNLLSDNQWKLLRQHVIYTLIGTGICVFAVLLWIASSNSWRSLLWWVVMPMLIVGYGSLMTAAWFAGEMVFAQGVAIETTPQPISLNTTTPSIHPSAISSPDYDPDAPAWKKKTDRYVNPLQAHIVFAGFVIAIALAAAALSIRGVTQEPDLLITQNDPSLLGLSSEPSAALSQHEQNVASALASSSSSNMAPLVSYVPPKVPSSRFWILLLVVAALTAAGGLYVGNNITVDTFKANILQGGDGHRDVAHSILAGSILVLALVLAGVTTFTPRSGIIVGGIVTLMVLVIAAQVYMGSLLLFDGSNGTLTRLNAATAATQPGATPSSVLPVVPAPTPPTTVLPTIPATLPASMPSVVTPPMIPLPSAAPATLPGAQP